MILIHEKILSFYGTFKVIDYLDNFGIFATKISNINT